MKKISIAMAMVALALTMVGCGDKPLTEQQNKVKNLKEAYQSSAGKGYWEDPDNYDDMSQMYCLKKGDQVGYYKVDLNNNTSTLIRVEFVG